MRRFYDYRQSRDGETQALRPTKRIPWDRLTEDQETEPPEPGNMAQRDFWAAAELLRRCAQEHGGCLLADVGADEIGRITLRCRELLHTDDQLESTRFLLGYLFLKFETVYLQPVDGWLELNVIADLKSQTTDP